MELLQSLGPLPMFILMFFVLYIVLIRPQIKEQKNRDAMLTNLIKGDKIISKGGIVGKIKEIQGKNKEFLIIDNETGSKIKILRAFVNSKVEK